MMPKIALLYHTPTYLKGVMWLNYDMYKDRDLYALQISHMGMKASSFTGQYIVWSADQWNT